MPGMNSDVLALWLSIALALTKTIVNLLNGTLSGFSLFITLIFSLSFWLPTRHACDVLTKKGYIRTIPENGFKVIYIYRDKEPITYIMAFVSHLGVSLGTALVLLLIPAK